MWCTLSDDCFPLIVCRSGPANSPYRVLLFFLNKSSKLRIELRREKLKKKKKQNEFNSKKQFYQFIILIHNFSYMLQFVSVYFGFFSFFSRVFCRICETFFFFLLINTKIFWRLKVMDQIENYLVVSRFIQLQLCQSFADFSISQGSSTRQSNEFHMYKYSVLPQLMNSLDDLKLKFACCTHFCNK